MTHNEIIKNLSELDLKDTPIETVVNNLKEFGKFGVMLTTLHPSKRIIRARISEEYSFQHISELSYKPQGLNKTYQRASTPYQTMFYGAIVPEILGQEEPGSARITTIFEVSDFLKDQNSKGEIDITFSVWEVISDIELVSLIHHKKFERPTKLSIRLQEQYEELIKSNPDLEIPSREISEFLGNQFAKEPIRLDSDYKISATYSEMVTGWYDGVLYPSVQLAGEGINIAIKPESADKKLKFLGAAECTLYKNEKNSFLGNNTHSIIKPDGALEFEKIDDQFYVSKESGRKHVGLK